ncbi:MAG: DUF1735 domain-containing protein [Dysgonamonadaceae bacterium]|jgi:hypothetical protein|nr:DUF1735 domain-containing protein [Dysgonamonadaceae bacterium]
MKNLKITKIGYALAVFSTVWVFSACNDKIDDFGKTTGSDASNEVYLNAPFEYNIVHTVNEGTHATLNGQPVDTILVKFPILSVQPVVAATTIKVVRDYSLIDVYNAKNEGITYYSPIESDISFDKDAVAISAGDTSSKDSITIHYKNPLRQLTGITGSTGRRDYLIPLRILTVSGQDVKIKYDERICYIKVTVAQEDGIGFGANEQNISFTNIPAVSDDANPVPFSLSTQLFNVANGNGDLTLSVNNNLVAAYNSEHGTNYKAISGISPINATIEEGSKTVSGSIPLQNLAAGSYLIPLEITSHSNNVQIVDAKKVFYTILTVSEAGSGAVTATKSATQSTAIANPGLGTQQESRSAYNAWFYNANTGAKLTPSGSATAMFQTPFADTYFSNVPNLDAVIDLGSEVSNISGFSLSGYTSTANRFAQSYDVCYATEAQFNNQQETYMGSLSGCLRYVYVSFSAPITARYILLRNVKPQITSGTSYMGWEEFFIYTN